MYDDADDMRARCARRRHREFQEAYRLTMGAIDAEIARLEGLAREPERPRESFLSRLRRWAGRPK